MFIDCTSSSLKLLMVIGTQELIQLAVWLYVLRSVQSDCIHWHLCFCYFKYVEFNNLFRQVTSCENNFTMKVIA